VPEARDDGDHDDLRVVFRLGSNPSLSGKKWRNLGQGGEEARRRRRPSTGRGGRNGVNH